MKTVPLTLAVLVFAGCAAKSPPMDTDTDNDADTDADTDSDTDADTDTDTQSDTDSGYYYDSGYWSDYGYSLDLTGTGYGTHDGVNVWYQLYDEDGVLFDYDEDLIASDGAISFYTWGLGDGIAYELDVIADANGSRMCDTVPNDHAWRYPIAAVSDDVTLDQPHTTTFANDASVCERWSEWHYDVSLAGTGYNVHDGMDVHYALVDSELQEVYFTSDATITSGAIAVTFEDAFWEYTPYLDIVWYVDSNGTAGCQPTTESNPDHQWMINVENWDTDVALTYDHDVNFLNVCWAFASL